MIFYSLFSIIAQVVFTIASKILILIDDLSKYNFFNQGTINDFTSKVYVIIGVLMLFKLVISAVQYIVNPDMFDDKNKGLGAVLKKSIIVVILLAIVPSIFTLAMEIQGDVVEQIPKVIFGNRNYSVSSASDDISMTIMSSFLNVKDGRTTSKVLNSVGDFNAVATDGCGSISLLPASWANAITGEWCNYDLMVLLSPIAAVFFAYILISLTIDVATRTIKLGIVQILAPIPITEYITDEKKMTNWAKTSVQIYVDLFIRLAVIYLIIYIIQVVLHDMFGTSGYEALRQGVSGATGRNPDTLELGLIKIIIIAALLLFAKNAPKFITELLGLKGAGEGFNDMFKRAGGLFGATTAGLTGGLANYQNRIRSAKGKWDANTSFGKKMRDRLSAVGSAGAGMTSATFRGGRASLNGKGFKEAFNTGHKGAITARQNREMDQMNEVGNWDRIKTRYQDFMGLDTAESLAENKQKAYSTLHQDVGSFKKAVMGRIDKNPSVAIRNDIKIGSTVDQIGQLLAANAQTIMNGSNEDLKNIFKKFQVQKVVDKNGVAHQVYSVRAGEHLGYYDLEAIRVNAEQEHIGSISAKIDPLKTIAQKEIFSDAMAGRVEDISGNLIDEFNYGDAEYERRGIKRQREAHSDITTSVQNAMQHIAENAVPLNGGDATELQNWFRGISTHKDHKGQDFGGLDDFYQRESEKISATMATSREARARESNKRHDTNKQQNSGKK